MSLMSKILRRQSVMYSLAKEPPFRLFAKALLKRSSAPLRLRAEWDAVVYPEYLVALIEAVEQAKKESVGHIAALEFGVERGTGLLALQGFAEAVEREYGVQISVYGFDTGRGLPDSEGDFRNHPDIWKAGDYPMDYSRLKSQLKDRTRLILGDVADTVPEFVAEIQSAPLGFVSVDVDYYSSTLNALRVLTLPGKRMLRVLPMYFDDVYIMSSHRYAGELAAIDEFNRLNDDVKIDRWRDIDLDRPFPNAGWLRGMYLAHDLAAISNVRVAGEPAHMPVQL